MHIEFTYSRPAAYFTALYRHNARRIARRFLIAALVWAGVGSVCLFAGQGEGIGAIVGFGALLLAVILPFRARQSLRAPVTMPPTAHAPRKYVITDDGLESSTELTSVRWTWPVVHRVDERPEAYVFWQEARQWLDVPRAPLSSQQEADLRTLLRERGLLNDNA